MSCNGVVELELNSKLTNKSRQDEHKRVVLVLGSQESENILTVETPGLASMNLRKKCTNALEISSEPPPA